MVIGAQVFDSGHRGSEAQPMVATALTHFHGSAMDVAPKVVQDVRLQSQKRTDLGPAALVGIQIQQAELVNGMVDVTPRAIPGFAHRPAEGIVLLFSSVLSRGGFGGIE